MNTKELAALLNGTGYGEVHSGTKLLAKENGLVIVYGASDDLMEFRGAIHEELNAWDGTVALFDNGELLLNKCDDGCPYFSEKVRSAREKGMSIEQIWHPKGNPSWTYETDVPHETFQMMEDGELYCIGIVFALTDVPEVKA